MRWRRRQLRIMCLNSMLTSKFSPRLLVAPAERGSTRCSARASSPICRRMYNIEMLISARSSSPICRRMYNIEILISATIDRAEHASGAPLCGRNEQATRDGDD
jgi:hypothetical protein